MYTLWILFGSFLQLCTGQFYNVQPQNSIGSFLPNLPSFPLNNNNFVNQGQVNNGFDQNQAKTDQVEDENRRLPRSRRMEEVFRWKQLGYESLQPTDKGDFVFPGLEPNKVGAPNFIPANNVPMGADHYNGLVFITVPRRRPGVPSTLNYVDLNQSSRNKSPLLKPYPDIQTNALHSDLRADPNKLVSVYRVRIDECDRMWFVDTGRMELPDNATQVQPPSVWYINLRSGARHRFEFPSNILTVGTGVASITVDVDPSNCGNAFAYIPDLINAQLYVYSLARNQMWAFSHNYFRLDPLKGDLSVAGLQYQWDDNLFSITLGPRQSNGFRQVYFHPMITNNEFVVSSEVLQNQANTQRTWHGDDFKLLGNRGEGRQSAMHHFDLSTGIIFYTFIGQNAIGCWNSNRPYNKGNIGIVAKDDENMIYPSDLKTDRNGTLWVISNSLPIFIYSQLNENQFNFRVWRANARDIVKGTVCQGPNNVVIQIFNRIYSNLQPNPNKILSILRPRIDECERLWFIDSGNVALSTGARQIQQPSIWFIDLNTGARHRFEIPASTVTAGGGMGSITIDVDPNDCGNAFAYIPDLTIGQLYVYSLAQNKIWTFVHTFFRLDPFKGDFNLRGINFQFRDNIFSTTLGPRDDNGFRTVYFHALVSTKEFVVSSQVLQNELNAKRFWQGDDFKYLGDRGSGRQTNMHQYDPNTGVIFYAFMGQNAIGCWNSNKPYNKGNHAVIFKDNERMVL